MARMKLRDDLAGDLAEYKEKYGARLDRVAATLESSQAELLGVLTTHCFTGLAGMDPDTADCLRFAAGRVLDAAAE